jgi:hypothetical protein
MTDTPPKGRPTIYTKELADLICSRLAETGNLRAVCKADGMPPESTVRGWALDDREGFAAQYARAREIGYQSMADDLLDIADDSSGDTLTDPETGVERINTEFVARSRLRADTRKWLLSKALPKIYGDKVALTGEDGGAVKVQVTRIERVIVDNPKGKPNG